MTDTQTDREPLKLLYRLVTLLDRNLVHIYENGMILKIPFDIDNLDM